MKKTAANSREGWRFSRPFSLRANMLVSFGLLVAVTLLVINLVRTFGIPFTTYSGSYGDHISEAMRNLNLIADLKKDRFLLWLEERRNDAKALARNQVIAASLPDLRKKIQDSLASGRTGNALSADVLGQEVYKSVFQRLRLIKNTHSVYEKIQLVDSGTGLVLASTEETEVGDNVSGKPYLPKVQTLPDGVWVAIEPGRSTDRTSVVFSAWTHSDGHGNPAVAVMFVNMDAVVKPMLYTGEGLGESGGAMLFNEDAQILMPLKHHLPDGTIAKVLETRLDTRAALLAAEGKEESFVGRDYRGVPVLAASRSLKIIPGVNWRMVVKVDRAEVLHRLWQRVLHSMLLSFACLIAGGVLAVVIARRISRPIEKLSQIAQKVESGDVRARAEADGSREVEVLSATFNSMMERIQQWHEELEKQVKARTYDLTAEIARRKQAEADLVQEKERLAVTLRSIGDGVISTDTDGKVVSLNGAAEQLTGWSQREAAGKPLPDVFSIINEITRERCENPVDKVLSTGLVVGLANHTALICRDGTERVIADSGAPIRDENGATIGVVLVFRDVTEKRRADERFQKEKEFTDLTIESLPGLFYVVDENMRFIRWNTTLERVTGYSSDEIYDLNAIDLFSGENRRIIEEGVHQVFSEGEAFREALLVTKGGREIPFLLTGTQIPFEGKRAIVGMAVDITERKLAEDALKESEQRFKAIFNSDHVIMLLIDPENARIEDASPGACRFYGWSLQDLRKMKISDINILTPEQIFERMQAAKLRQKKFFDFRHRLANGEIRDVEVCSGPILIGGRSLLFSVINDVTDRKRAEAELRRSEGRYRTLFEQSRDAVHITSREGTLLDANQAFLDLFGFTREEAENMDIVTIYADPADWTRFKKEIEDKGSVENYEIEFHRKDGVRLECLLTSTLRLDTDGTILGYQGIIRDVTEHKQLQKQLTQAQKMEAIGTLAGGVAHDFNNLLTVTSGYAELLLQSKDPGDPDYGDLEKILHTSRRGAELVRNLLTLSRKGDSQPRPINLNHEIEQVKELLDRTVPKMIEIKTHLAADVGTVDADPGQIGQVLMNLAVNARDAMPHGGKLVIETENVCLDKEYSRVSLGAVAGEYVVLSVSDTGDGMDRETLDHIYEPFFTTKAAGKGTGLGLATVYGIVKQHGGYITCSSERGDGTKFRIYFPAAKENVEQGVTATGTMPAFGTETVLLVDDEELVRELGKRILTRAGYTVLTAGNGREALELYRGKKDEISVVILDLIMPQMGGTKCLKQLLEIDPHAVVLISSGYAADSGPQECIELGAKGFVGKPFKINVLLQQVRKTLNEG